MLVTRYLLRNLLSVAAFVAVTLTAVIWLTQSLKLLELVANSDAPPWIFLKLVALTLPRFLEIIIPLSLVVAVLFVYNKMVMDNELIVMRACGFDQIALARPALMLGLAATALVFCLTAYLSPRAYSEMQILRQMVKAEYSSFLLREGVFNTLGDNMTVYLRARGKDNELFGLMIHDMRDKERPPVTVTAKRGKILMDGDIPNIVVFDGMRQQMEPSSGTISKLYFSRYTIEVKGFENDTPARWREAGERTLSELIRPDLQNPSDRVNLDLFRAEANQRILLPFNALGFTLVALCAVLLGPFNRRGQSRKIAAGACLVVALQALALFIVNLSKKHVEAASLLLLVTVLPVFIGYYLLTAGGEQTLRALLRRLGARKEAAA